MNRLYLVRHGENLANLTLEFSSRKVDYSLTPKGVLQAQQTGEYFRVKNIHAIYCSPLKRAYETAEYIGAVCGVQPVIMENFREIDVGDLEGQPPTKELWDYHNRIFFDWLDGNPAISFPNGDDYFKLWERMRTGIEQVCAGRDEQNIVIVAHGGIFSATLKDLCPGIDIYALLRKLFPNCGITTIEAEDGPTQPRCKLIAWGESGHLSGEAAVLVRGIPEEDGTFSPHSASLYKTDR
jgi:2,3-bisphosphoglycerate-dependent phosphoglycerate mutase